MFAHHKFSVFLLLDLETTGSQDVAMIAYTWPEQRCTVFPLKKIGHTSLAIDYTCPDQRLIAIREILFSLLYVLFISSPFISNYCYLEPKLLVTWESEITRIDYNLTEKHFLKIKRDSHCLIHISSFGAFRKPCFLIVPFKGKLHRYVSGADPEGIRGIHLNPFDSRFPSLVFLCSIFLITKTNLFKYTENFYHQKLKFQIKILIFSYFCSKHRLWVLWRGLSNTNQTNTDCR